MHIQPFRPHPLLQPYVDNYIKVSSSGPVPVAPERYHPPTGIVLVIQTDPDYHRYVHQVNGHRLPRLTLMGQWDRSGLWSYPARIDSLVVTFTPTGFAKLFRLPTADFANGWEALPALLSRQQTDDLADQLTQAREAARQVAILDAFFLPRVKSGTNGMGLAEWALCLLEQFHGNLPVETLADRLRVSRQYLTRTFTAQVGVSPKAYSEILRFKRALQLLKREPDPDFQDVLHQCGYYDQSHFIKSFVRYAGQSPGRYLSETKVIADIMLAI
jgi:AraC-like DNA-binding protein